MFTLMVQEIYLYYIAHCKKIKLRVSRDIYIKNVTANVNTIYKTYLVEEHYFTLNTQLKEYIDKHYIFLDISEHLQVFINNLIVIIDSSMVVIQRYFAKYKDFLNMIPYVRGYYEEFNLVYFQLIKNHLPNFKSARIVMECL